MTTAADKEFKALAMQAVDYANANFRKEEKSWNIFKKQKDLLDFSEESIHVVEEILSQLHDSLKDMEQMERQIKKKQLPQGTIIRDSTGLNNYEPSDEKIRMISLMFAGYIGEVIMRSWGKGTWLGEDDPKLKNPNGPALVLEKGLILFPVAAVYKRILIGQKESIWKFYVTMKLLNQENMKLVDKKKSSTKDKKPSKTVHKRK